MRRVRGGAREIGCQAENIGKHLAALIGGCSAKTLDIVEAKVREAGVDAALPNNPAMRQNCAVAYLTRR